MNKFRRKSPKKNNDALIYVFYLIAALFAIVVAILYFGSFLAIVLAGIGLINFSVGDILNYTERRSIAQNEIMNIQIKLSEISNLNEKFSLRRRTDGSGKFNRGRKGGYEAYELEDEIEKSTEELKGLTQDRRKSNAITIAILFSGGLYLVLRYLGISSNTSIPATGVSLVLIYTMFNNHQDMNGGSKFVENRPNILIAIFTLAFWLYITFDTSQFVRIRWQQIQESAEHSNSELKK